MTINNIITYNNKFSISKYRFQLKEIYMLNDN